MQGRNKDEEGSGESSKAPKDLDGMLKDCFRDIGIGSEDLISKDQFMTAMAMYAERTGTKYSKRKLNAMFKDADWYQTGNIEMRELIASMNDPKLMTNLYQGTWSIPGPAQELVGVLLEATMGQIRIRDIKQGSLADKYHLPIGAFVFAIDDQPCVAMKPEQVQKLMRRSLSHGPMRLHLRFSAEMLDPLLERTMEDPETREAMRSGLNSGGVFSQETLEFGKYERIGKEEEDDKDLPNRLWLRLSREFHERVRRAVANLITVLRMLGVAWRLLLWAVQWMRMEYRADFNKCMRLMLINAVWKFFEPLLVSHIFDIAIPGMQSGRTAQCAVDAIGGTTIMILGSLIFVFTSAKLSDAQMDGSGFIPFMKQQLAVQIMKMPQIKLDTKNERQILDLINLDLQKLNGVICAYFAFVASSLELMTTFPSLALISRELTWLLALTCVFLMVQQLRHGGFIMTASHAVQKSELNFSQSVEEGIVYVTTKKLLGLDLQLGGNVGRRHARLQAAYKMLEDFELMLSTYVNIVAVVVRAVLMGVGAALLYLPSDSDSGSLDVGFPPVICMCYTPYMGRYCGNETDGGLSADGGPRTLLRIGQLAAFIGAYPGVLDLCNTIIGAVRDFMIATESLDNIQPFLDDAEVDSWPKSREWSDSYTVLAEKFRGIDSGIDLRQSSSLRRSESRAMVLSVAPTSPFASRKAQSFAARLRPGCEILSVNGNDVKKLHARVISKSLNDLGGSVELLVRAPGILCTSTPSESANVTGVPEAINVRGVGFAYAVISSKSDGKDGPATTEGGGVVLEKKSMRQGVSVLNGVNMDVPQGAKVALIGRTGVGKSTLMKIIARLYQPKGGSVHVMGEAVNSIDITKQIVYMEQESKVIGGTIRQQLTMGLMTPDCLNDPLKVFRNLLELTEQLEDDFAFRKGKTQAKLKRTKTISLTKYVHRIDETRRMNDFISKNTAEAEADEVGGGGRSVKSSWDTSTESPDPNETKDPPAEGDTAFAPADRAKETRKQRKLRELRVQWALFVYQLAWLLQDQVEDLYGSHGHTASNETLSEETLPLSRLLSAFSARVSNNAALLEELFDYFWAVGEDDASFDEASDRFSAEYINTIKSAVLDKTVLSVCDSLLATELEHYSNQACAWQIFQVLGESQSCAPLDVDVGPRGKRLSGGQQQLLCIARLFMLQDYRNSSIVILDEPAAALDQETARELGQQLVEIKYRDSEAAERDITERNALSLAELKKEAEEGMTTSSVEEFIPEISDGRAPVTVIASTHNLTLIDNFTHAAVLQNGQVVEFDKIANLEKQKGHFFRYKTRQTGLSIDRRGNARVEASRIKQIWLFASAPLFSLQKLSSRFCTKRLRAGDQVYKEGEDADRLFLIVNGQVEAKSTRASETHVRLIFQTGDEIGVDGLLDNDLTWEQTAKVTSADAVLLELLQTDLEDAIMQDPDLEQSVGHLRADILTWKSPKQLQMLWPFCGATLEELEPVSRLLSPKVFMEDQMVFSMPRSPCAELSMLIQGSLDIVVSHMEASANEDKVAEEVLSTLSLKGGQMFGVQQMCPPANGNPGMELVVNRGPVAKRAKAKMFTLALQLEQTSLTRLLEENKALSDAYVKIVTAIAHFINPETLRTHWLLCGAGNQFLSELSPLWEIVVAGEGRRLIDETDRDNCFIVVRGVVEVRRKRGNVAEDAITQIDRMTAGSFINVTGLLGRSSDDEIDSAEVVLPTADDHKASAKSFGGAAHLHAASKPDPDAPPSPTLLLRLSKHAFKQVSQKPMYSTTVEPLMRRISASLHPLLTLAGLQDPNGVDAYEGIPRRVNRSIDVQGMDKRQTMAQMNSPRAQPSLTDKQDQSDQSLIVPSRLPDLMMKIQLQIVAQRQEISVHHKLNEILLETAEFKGSNLELRKAAQKMDAGLIMAALPISQRADATTNVDYWGLEQKLFFVAEGELEAIAVTTMGSERTYEKIKLVSKIECERKAGRGPGMSKGRKSDLDEETPEAHSASANEGERIRMFSAFGTPYQQDLLGETSMPKVVRVVIRRAPVILISVDLRHASDNGLEAYRAAQEKLKRELEEREQQAKEVRKVEKKASTIMYRLGLKKPRVCPPGLIWRISEPGKALWHLALKRYRVMHALQVDMSSAQIPESTKGSSIEDQMFKATNELIEVKGLQRRRVEMFAELIEEWLELGPDRPKQTNKSMEKLFEAEVVPSAFFRAVIKDIEFLDTNEAIERLVDLSSERLNNCKQSLQLMKDIRRTKKEEMIKDVRQLWALSQAHPSPDKEASLAKATDLKTSTFIEIAELKGEAISHLGPRMMMIQKSLDKLWATLCLPPHERRRLMWDEGQKLHEELFYECVQTEEQLQSYMLELGPVFDANRGKPDALASILEQIMPILRSSEVGKGGEIGVQVAISLAQSGIGGGDSSSSGMQKRLNNLRKQHRQEIEDLEEEIEILKESSDARDAQIEALARAEQLRAEEAQVELLATQEEKAAELAAIEEKRKKELALAEQLRQDDMARLEAKRRAQLQQLEDQQQEEIRQIERDQELHALQKEKQMKELEEKKRLELQKLEDARKADLERMAKENEAKEALAAAQHEKEKMKLRAKAMAKDAVDNAKFAEQQEARRRIYEPLLIEREELVDQMHGYMKMVGLLPHESLWKDFEKQHNNKIPDGSNCDDEDVTALQTALPKLRRVVARMQERIDTDSIILALRATGKRAGQKSMIVAKQMTSGAKAIKDPNLDPNDKVSLEQVQQYLIRAQISYTDSAWTFFLQSVESGNGSKLPIKLKKLTAALDAPSMKLQTV